MVVEKGAEEDMKDDLIVKMVDCSAMEGAMYVARKRDEIIEARDRPLYQS